MTSDSGLASQDTDYTRDIQEGAHSPFPVRLPAQQGVK